MTQRRSEKTKRARLNHGLASAALGATLALAGCDAAIDAAPDEPVEGATHEIRGGTPGLNPNELGIVALLSDLPGNQRRVCSGVLLDNDWVLTARHCLENNVIFDPKNLTVGMGANTGAFAQERHGAVIEVHPILDAALVKLDAPMAVNGLLHGQKRLFFGQTPEVVTQAQLPVRCYGYGQNSIDANDTGVFRYADVKVTGYSTDMGTAPTFYRDYQGNATTPNALGQIQLEGDSGGPCLYVNPGAPSDPTKQVIVGITRDTIKNSQGVTLSADIVGADLLKKWAADTMIGKASEFQGDFNGDGASDVIWNVPGGLPKVWITDTGKRGQRGGWTLPRAATGADWLPIATADFNDDGKVDLVWQNRATGAHIFQFLDGQRVIGTRTDIATAAVWRLQGAGDFNRDGQNDLLYRNDDGQIMVSCLDRNQEVIDSLYLDTVVDRNWQIGGIADFNGDLVADIVWKSRATGQIGMWYQAPDGRTIGYSNIATVNDPNWQLRQAGDFDRDGKADLLFQNVATDQLSYWFLRDGLTDRYFDQIWGPSGVPIPPTTVSGATLIGAQWAP